MMIGNMKHLESLQRKWEEEYERLLTQQEQYCNTPEQYPAQRLVLYQMQFIDSMRLDFRDVIREFSTTLQKISSNQKILLDDVIQKVEEKIDSLEERSTEDVE